MATPHADIYVAGRIFSIIGDASGMGFATAALLTEHGAKAIWIADLQIQLFDSVRTKLSAINPAVEIHLDKVDVSKSDEVDAWVDKIVEESGALHGAANIAGLPEPVEEVKPDVPRLIEQTSENWR
jgi:chanoclavine-I dehydrogenase